MLAAAREAALSVGFPPSPAIADAAVAAELAPLRTEANRTDAAGAWMALAGYGALRDVDGWDLRQWLRAQGVAAAVNAVLRAGDDAEAAQAASALAGALEASGDGRRALDRGRAAPGALRLPRARSAG